MDNIRSSNNDAACWLPCQIAIGRCSIARRLLVAEANKPDSEIDGSFEDRCYWVACEAEDGCYADLLEGAGDELSTVYACSHFFVSVFLLLSIQD